MASTAASKERTRCIRIVQKYRHELTAAYTKRPFATNAKQVLRLIQRLQEMEEEMGSIYSRQLSAKHKSSMPVLEGDFSIEEIERAQEIIAEQEQNPFTEG